MANQKKKTLSLRNARTTKQLCSLQRDNIDAGDFWIIADEADVTIAAQKTGEHPTERITIPRRYFNRLIDFYQRGQRVRASK